MVTTSLLKENSNWVLKVVSSFVLFSWEDLFSSFEPDSVRRASISSSVRDIIVSYLQSDQHSIYRLQDDLLLTIRDNWADIVAWPWDTSLRDNRLTSVACSRSMTSILLASESSFVFRVSMMFWDADPIFWRSSRCPDAISTWWLSAACSWYVSILSSAWSTSCFDHLSTWVQYWMLLYIFASSLAWCWRASSRSASTIALLHQFAVHHIFRPAYLISCLWRDAWLLSKYIISIKCLSRASWILCSRPSLRMILSTFENDLADESSPSRSRKVSVILVHCSKSWLRSASNAVAGQIVLFGESSVCIRVVALARISTTSLHFCMSGGNSPVIRDSSYVRLPTL